MDQDQNLNKYSIEEDIKEMLKGVLKEESDEETKKSRTVPRAIVARIRGPMKR